MPMMEPTRRRRGNGDQAPSAPRPRPSAKTVVKARAEVGHEQRGRGAENRGRVARGKTLEPAAEGIGDAVKTVGHMRVGPGPAQRQAKAIVEKPGQRRAEKTDHRDATPRAAFRPGAIKPDGQRQRHVVGRIIAPGAEEPGDLASGASMPAAPPVELFPAVAGREARSARRAPRPPANSAEQEPFPRAEKQPESAQDGAPLGHAGDNEARRAK